MLQPWGKGLMGTTLRYPTRVRAEKDYFDEIPDVKIPKEMLALPAISWKRRRPTLIRPNSTIAMSRRLSN